MPYPPVTSTATATTPQAELSLAIIKPQVLPSGSEFGWSLGPHDADAGLVPLGALLCQCGIRWVKFPFAIQETPTPPTADSSKEKPGNQARKDENLSGNAEKNPASAVSGTGMQAGSKVKKSEVNSLEGLINFSDQLSTAGVHLAGVLQPPRVAGDTGMKSCDLLAAEAFARDPKTWYPSIEPVLARLGTEIRCWQIGDDRDPGWMGCRDLPGTFRAPRPS